MAKVPPEEIDAARPQDPNEGVTSMQGVSGDEDLDKKGSARYYVEVLGKALDILDVLRNSRVELRLTDIAESAQIDISTTFRLLRTLEGRGYVLRDKKTKRFRLRLGDRAYRIGYAQLSSDQPFSLKVTEGLVEVARNLSVDLLIRDNQNNPEEAVKNAAWLIDQKVDFAIEYQFHYRVAPLLADMFSKAGISVLAIDIPQPGSTYFGVNNFSVGFLGGEVLARFAQEKWKGHVGHVLLLEYPEAGPVPYSRVLGTLEGIQSVRGKLPGSRALHKSCKGTEQGGYLATRRVLPQIGKREHLLIAAANDNSARGAIRAVREAHREPFTAILAQGWGPDPALDEELESLNSPLIGAVSYKPEEYGSQLLPIVLKRLNGEAVPPAVYARHKLIARKEVLALSTAVSP